MIGGETLLPKTSTDVYCQRATELLSSRKRLQRSLTLPKSQEQWYAEWGARDGSGHLIKNISTERLLRGHTNQEAGLWHPSKSRIRQTSAQGAAK